VVSFSVDRHAKSQECDRLETADNSGDLETVLFLYDDDAILLPPNEATVSGKPAIGKRYEALFARTRTAARFEVDEEGPPAPTVTSTDG